MATRVANIKITTNGIITDWWKLNYYDNGQGVSPFDYTIEDGIFKDSGEGDDDFYAYWYSICYLAGMLNVFRRIFRDIESYEYMLRRFLTSREIAFDNNSTMEELLYLYRNWVKEIEKRGTTLVDNCIGYSHELGYTGIATTGIIQTDIDNNSGIGIKSGTPFLYGILPNTINLGTSHEIMFDVILSGIADAGSQGSIFMGTNTHIKVLSNGSVNSEGLFPYIVKYKCPTEEVDLEFAVEADSLNHIRVVRIGGNLFLYVNGILSDKGTVTASTVFSFVRMFGSGLTKPMANIVINVKDTDFVSTKTYTWKCNEGAGFILDSGDGMDSASFTILPTETFSDIWVRDSRFNNTGFTGITGELRRLLNYTGGECLFELIATSEMGLCIDVSSPISEEASCINLNKSYAKGSIEKLGQYPFSFDEEFIFKQSGWIVKNFGAVTNWGLNNVFDNLTDWRTLDNVKPIGLVPFIPIPIATDPDDMEGYEISFVIESNENIALKFGLNLYDKDMIRLNDLTKNYEDDTNSDEFLHDVTFSMCNGVELWVRGVYSLQKMGSVADKLNIGLGNNLYNNSQNLVKYLLPIISIDAATPNTQVKLKDITVRPLTLNTSKGVVSNKNKIIAYLKNESGQTDDAVTEFIDSKLTPYNCTTNIQYL